MWKQQTVKAGDDKQIRTWEGSLITDQLPEKVLRSVWGRLQKKNGGLLVSITVSGKVSQLMRLTAAERKNIPEEINTDTHICQEVGTSVRVEF